MKILQLNFEKGWRGGERQTLYCMRAFRKAGHEVELMCRRGGPLAERARQEGFTVHECRNVPAQLRFLAGAGRYDIIHAQTANTVTWAVLTKWLHRRRWPSRAAPPSWSSRTRNGRPASVAPRRSVRGHQRDGRERAAPARHRARHHPQRRRTACDQCRQRRRAGQRVPAGRPQGHGDLGRADPGQGPGHAGARRRRAGAHAPRLHLSALRRRRRQEQAARTRPASWASRTSTASPAFARAWKTSTACWTCSS